MGGKGRKNLTHIIMNTILEKILTDKATRGPEEAEAFAAAQNSFDSWD